MKGQSAVFIWNRPIKVTKALTVELDAHISYLINFLKVKCFWFIGKSAFNAFCFKAVSKRQYEKSVALLYTDDEYESVIDICRVGFTYKDDGTEPAVEYAKRKKKLVVDLCKSASACFGVGMQT